MISITKIVDNSTEERVLGRILASVVPGDALTHVGGGEGGSDSFTGIGGKNHGPPRPDDCAAQ